MLNFKKTETINFKQEELIENLIKEIRDKFPEIRLIDIVKSPEDPESLWIEITAPENEERELDLRDFASNKVTDIFLDYGYHMLVMPTRNQVV